MIYLEALGIWLVVATITSLLLGLVMNTAGDDRYGNDVDVEMRFADHARSLGWSLVVSYTVLAAVIVVGGLLLFWWLRVLFI